MTDAITGIDHCIILVNDLDAACTRMVRLGFAPAPRGVHSDHMGTHNHCVMLDRGYFEVLAIRHDTERNARWRNVLARREGLAAIALQTADAHAAHATFHANGVESKDLVDFSRPVELDDSEVREASFTTVTLPEDLAPVPMFLCQHHTPDLVWRPQYLRQPNGINGVAGLVVAVDDPGATAARMARAFGSERVTATDSGHAIVTSAGRIDLLTPEALAKRYTGIALDPRATTPYVAALVLTARYPDKTRDYIESQGIDMYDTAAGTLCVAPEDGCGALLEVVQHRG